MTGDSSADTESTMTSLGHVLGTCSAGTVVHYLSSAKIKVFSIAPPRDVALIQGTPLEASFQSSG
jgi:hypothetical protein